MNNPDVELRIRSLSPRRETRRVISHTKNASDASTRIDDDGEALPPIKRPSFIRPGFKALQRLQTGAATTLKSSAPKLKSKIKEKKNDTVNATPKAKKSSVRAVLNATFESLIPSVRRDPTSGEANQPPPVDENDDTFQDGGSPELEFHPPPTPPPLTPPAAEVVNINPDYEPYSPTAASRGAGTSSHADWYVNLPPAGWHSLSATAHPCLPPVSSRPSTSTSTSANPTTDELSSRPKPNRKRNRGVISDDDSDSPEPTTVKKRKYTLDDDVDPDLSKGPDPRLGDAVSPPPDTAMADPGANAVVEDQDLLEVDDEEDQLAESTQEPSPRPALNFWTRKRMESPERSDSPANFEDAMEDIGGNDDNDIQMNDTTNNLEGDETIQAPAVINHDLPMPSDDASDAVLSTDEDSEPEINGPIRYLDRAEQERKALLDEFTDVLDQHPEFRRGYRRPGLSPADAPWVVSFVPYFRSNSLIAIQILAPLLRRKLELERIKLEKFENGE